MSATHSDSRRLVASHRWAVALMLLGTIISGCGTAASGTTADKVEGDATATYAVVLTQVADAKSFVATATAEAKVTKPTPTATVKATRAAEPTATTNPFANVAPSPNFEGDILTLLPTVEQLPPEFKIVAEGPLSARLIAEAYVDEVGFEKQLEGWGFRQAAARAFAIPQVTPAEQNVMMTVVNTAVIEFGSPEQARDSMEANRDYVKKGIIGDPPNITLEGLGDYALALEGEVRNGAKYEQWAFIWVQQGNIVLYFRGMSMGYVPMEETLQIAKNTLAQ